MCGCYCGELVREREERVDYGGFGLTYIHLLGTLLALLDFDWGWCFLVPGTCGWGFGFGFLVVNPNGLGIKMTAPRTEIKMNPESE